MQSLDAPLRHCSLHTLQNVPALHRTSQLVIQACFQVASALVKLNAPKSLAMGVVPMGTANDFATSIGLPEDPWEALQLCTMDTAQPIDVGVVNDKVCWSLCLTFLHSSW